MAVATAAALALAGTAISTGVSVYGQRQAANSAEEAADYNAKIAEQDANRKELENHETVKRQRLEKRRSKAQARARLAGSGAALGEGSSVDFLEVLDNRLETEIQDSARRTQLETRAIRHQSSLQTYTADQQASASRVSSVGTLLGGATKATSQFSQIRYKSSS